MSTAAPASAPSITPTASPTPDPAPPRRDPGSDEVLSIWGLSWDQYVAINDALGDRTAVRVLYCDGTLTFVSPNNVHGWSDDSIDRFLCAIALGCDIELRPIGNTTLRRLRGEGLEGDSVYYLREQALQMAKPHDGPIDVGRHPVPDLAVEVENWHKATDAMIMDARLGVPEVWRHDVRRDTLTFHQLQADGTYEEIPRSLGFPFLMPADITDQLRRAEASPSFNRWHAQLTDWVRDVIRPRLDPALKYPETLSQP